MVGTRWVAELGSSHNGSLLRAVRLIDAAAEAGFTAVKTQQWTVPGLFRPEALEAHPLLRERSKNELPDDWHEALCGRAHERGILYGVTITDKASISAILPHVDFWKVSSYDLLRWKLISELAKTGKPVILSTGASTMAEVLDARLAYYQGHNALNAFLAMNSTGPIVLPDLTVLHCVSSYPCLTRYANLKAIDALQKQVCQPIGWSDHTNSYPVIERAVWRWKATTIELHVDLDDMLGGESEAGHVWSMAAAQGLIHYMNKTPLPKEIEREHEIDGHGVKAPLECEMTERNWRADPEDGLRPLKTTNPKP